MARAGGDRKTVGQPLPPPVPSAHDVAMNEDLPALEARIVELEIRSEERRDEIAVLHAHIGAYEARVAGLERLIDELKERVRSPAEAMPAPEDDLPPHY
jgi:uncharacterized coiled-coil protein SlyX